MKVPAKRNNSKTTVRTKGQDGFSKATYMFWFEMMLLARRFEEKAGQLYGQQKIRGFCHLYIGQEACAAGSYTALKKDDKWITAYRDHAHPLVLGSSPDAVMAELFGKETGLSKGKGGSMHMFDKEHNFFGGHGIVGGQIPLGAGIAFAEKYRKTNNICICFMGDGAVWQGAFHEALNLAMLWKLPIIFIIENNGYAMGTSVGRTTKNTSLHTLGASYNMPSKSVDGMSVEHVHKAVSEAAMHTRKGNGPMLLEFKTYRYKGHSMSDPARYRSKKEVNSFKEKDPIELLRETLFKQKIVSKGEVSSVEERVTKKIEEAVVFAEQSSYPDSSCITENVYKEPFYPFTID